MNDIALFYDSLNIYWHGIIVTTAIIALILCAAGLRYIQHADMRNFTIAALITVPCALLFSRITYCIFALENYSGLLGALFSPGGGNSLFGAAIGIAIALLIIRRLGLIDDIPSLLDCLAPAAAIGLHIGRLAGFFSGDDRGMEIAVKDIGGFIFACYDETQGQWELAIFVYESICAAVLFIATLIMFFWAYSKNNKCAKGGDVALLFLAGFGTTQGVLESMRTDSLTIIGLGFVRILQITALICIIIPPVIFSIRTVKADKASGFQFMVWTAQILLLVAAIYMEFTLGSDVLFTNYSVMSVCLFQILLLTIWQYMQFIKSSSHTHSPDRYATQQYKRFHTR